MNTNMTDFLAKMNEANSRALQSMIKFNEIATKAQGRMMRHQMAVLETCLEAGSKVADTVRTDPAALLTKGTEIGNVFGSRVGEFFRESLEMQTELQREMSGWVEEGLRAVSTPSEPAAEESGKDAGAA